jgi:hypothetical protein
MLQRLTTPFLLAGLACFVPMTGCTADVHDNNITANVDLDHANINLTANTDTSNVKEGSSVAMSVSVESGVFLIPPDQTPPPDKVSVAAHFQIYLDDDTTTPILITASTNINVLIAQSVPSW